MHFGQSWKDGSTHAIYNFILNILAVAVLHLWWASYGTDWSRTLHADIVATFHPKVIHALKNPLTYCLILYFHPHDTNKTWNVRTLRTYSHQEGFYWCHTSITTWIFFNIVRPLFAARGVTLIWPFERKDFSNFYRLNSHICESLMKNKSKKEMYISYSTYCCDSMSPFPSANPNSLSNFKLTWILCNFLQAWSHELIPLNMTLRLYELLW